jgi:hypothetical protein
MDVSLEFSGSINAPSAKAFIEFVEFLDDLKAPMFASRSLTYVLRTEPPVSVGIDGAADLISAWAHDRAARGEGSESDLLLTSARRIVDAYRANAIKNFDPAVFFEPFSDALVRRCPEGERARLEAGLLGLRDEIPRRWAARLTEQEFGETDEVELGGRRLSHAAAVAEVVARLERRGDMSDAEFEQTMLDLDRVLGSRAGLPFRTIVERVAAAGVDQFNSARTERAVRLFTLAAGLAEQFNLSQDDREGVWARAASSHLDAGLLAKIANESRRQGEVAALMRLLPDLGVEPVIHALSHERSRDRRRFFLKVLEMHGIDAIPSLLEWITARRASSGSWHLARNLVYVLSRLEVAFHADRRKIVAAVAPFLTSGQPQLRIAALAALRQLGGRPMLADVMPAVARALDANNYDLPTDAQGREALRRHLEAVLELLAGSEFDVAVALVAEVAAGAAGAEFDLGKELRDMATAVLARRKGPLPRRAALVVVNHLKHLTDRRLKLVVGGLAIGVDAAACRALAGLISDSAEPEAVEILATPLVRKIGSR